MRNKVCKMMKYTVLAFLLLLIVTEAVVIGTNAMGGEEAVAKLPVCILQIASDSMYPKLKTDDCVISLDTAFEKLKKGDIITFYSHGDLITHQIISVNEDGTVTTKGLMNSYADENITEEYYMGKVLCKIPFLSVFLKLVDTTMKKIVLLASVIAVQVIYYLYERRENREREMEQTR